MSEEEKVDMILYLLDTIQDYGVVEFTLKARNGRLVKKKSIKDNKQVAIMLVKSGILKEK